MTASSSTRRRLASWRLTRRVGGTAWRSAKVLLPRNGDVDEFVATVGARRGRRLKVLVCDLPDDAPSGLWLPTADVDYIVHGADLTFEHRRVVVCHEIAHMLLNHSAREGGIDTSAVAPTIEPSVAARFFTRHGYVDEVESEAEALGTLLAAELAARASAGRTRAVRTRDTVSSRLR